MSKEKNTEKTVPESGKEKEKATQQQPVFAPSLEEFLEGLIVKSSKFKDVGEIRKSILRFFAGFITISLITKSLRMRGCPPMQIADARKYNASFNIVCLRSAILDVLYFKTSKQQAIKDNLVSQADWDYFVKHLNIEELSLEACSYTLPDDLDDELVQVRIPSCKIINTQSSLGLLVENCLLSCCVSPTHRNEVRKGYLNLVLGKSTELELVDKFSDLYASLGIGFKRVINYIQKNNKALMEALKSGKAESKEIKQDIDYLNTISNIK